MFATFQIFGNVQEKVGKNFTTFYSIILKLNTMIVNKVEWKKTLNII